MSDTTSVINRPTPTPPRKKHNWRVWGVLVAGFILGSSCGAFATMTVMTKTDDVPVLTRDLEGRGFTDVKRVDGGGEDRMVSIPGYNPNCRFLITRNGMNEWKLTVPNSSAGDGTFEYPNPNAPQFAAKFPEQLKGCELAKK